MIAIILKVENVSKRTKNKSPCKSKKKKMWLKENKSRGMLHGKTVKNAGSKPVNASQENKNDTFKAREEERDCSWEL